MLSSCRVTDEPSARRATSKPSPRPLRSPTAATAARLGARRPVPALGVEHVDGDHLGGAAALHQEGPEAVEGADVEAALALE